MTQTERENMDRELWFWYFDQILRENGIISKQIKYEIEARSSL